MGSQLDGSIDDILNRLQGAVRENRRFRTLILTQAFEAWATDAQGQITELICDDGRAVHSSKPLPLSLRLENVHPEDLPALGRVIAEAQSTGAAFETVVRGRRTDGHWIRMELRGFPVHNDLGDVEEWVGLATDLTQQDEIEKQNRELTRRLESALETTMAELSERRRVEEELLSQNQVLERIVAGAPMVDILTDIVQSVERRLSDTIGSVLILNEHQCLNFAAGPNLPADYSSRLVNIPIGPNIGSCGTAAYTGQPEIVSDIASHPSWADYRHWVLPHGLAACWSVPIIARVQSPGNPAGESMPKFGESATHGEAPPRVLGTFALYQTQPCSPTEADLRIVKTAAYAAAIAIERELSHKALRESELRLARQSAELRHASRISSLGLMAAALSHEINQPLNALCNYASTCHALIEKSHDPIHQAQLKDCFQKISSSSLHAGEIVRRLRSFVSKDQLRRERHDFHTIINDALALMTPELRSRQVRLELRLAQGRAPLVGDAVQLQQVLVNVLTNSVDAMSAQPPLERLIVLGSSLSEKHVECRMTDAGPGFCQEVMERLYEPFLTTKSQGSGIGLSICRNIVEDHGGTIAIGNSPRGGAEVVVQLPLTDS